MAGAARLTTSSVAATAIRIILLIDFIIYVLPFLALSTVLFLLSFSGTIAELLISPIHRPHFPPDFLSVLGHLQRHRGLEKSLTGWWINNLGLKPVMVHRRLISSQTVPCSVASTSSKHSIILIHSVLKRLAFF
jgi:hypothetical protein